MEEKPCTYPTADYPGARRADGVFLRFADSFYFDEGNGQHPLTVALVRTSEGKILELLPRNVVFTA
ncbi:hypothetical protein M0D44_19945 [Xanthomonas prunicola]|uniref:hypothetical protein n=1 Tax=Xanthomonas prunicola TaxID=2053930 RepID=UPI0021B446DF|nr:hypothetical protein [Xanthomonas prunicola]UXA48517.1 hypothetical protein M0D44_19945 [Xanthomonas prunicola]